MKKYPDKNMKLMNTRIKDGIPLYLKLASVFRQKFHEGEWSEGNIIPKISILQAEYNVARSTVRRALSILIDEGLLESHRGLGTFVTKTPIREENDSDDKFKLDQVLSIKVLECSQINHIPDIPGNDKVLYGQWVKFSKVHLIKNKPFSVIHFNLPKKWMDLIPEELLDKSYLTQLIRDYCKIKKVIARQDITIKKADLELSKLLNIEFSAPVVQIDYIGFNQDHEIALVYRAYFDGNKFKLSRTIDNFFETEETSWRPIPVNI